MVGIAEVLRYETDIDTQDLKIRSALGSLPGC